MRKKIILAVLRAVVSLMAALAASVLFFAAGGRNVSLFILQIAAIFWFIFEARALLKVLPLKDTPLARFAKRTLGRFARLLLDLLAKPAGFIAGKFSKRLPERHKSKRLTLYKDEKSIVHQEKRMSANLFIKMKWKSLQNNRERIRFIYIAFLRKKIKEGAAVSPSDTPNELLEKFREKNLDLKDELFYLYNLARYGDDEGRDRIYKEDVESVLYHSPRRLNL